MSVDPEAIDALLAAQIREDIAAGERDVTMLCSPTTDRKRVDSLIAFCAGCGQAVWLSRRIAAVIFTADASPTILCIPCGCRRQAAMN